MIRRNFLKLIAALPFAGLFKSRKSEGLTVDKLLKCKEELHRKPCLSGSFTDKWEHRTRDGIWYYGEDMSTEWAKAIDDVIIEALT